MIHIQVYLQIQSQLKLIINTNANILFVYKSISVSAEYFGQANYWSKPILGHAVNLMYMYIDMVYWIAFV